MPLSDICFFHASLLYLTSGTPLFRSMKRLLFVNISEFQDGLADGFITYLQPESLPYFMDCNIRLFLYDPVNILEIRLAEARLAPTQREPGFHGAGFPHSFFQTVNSAGIYGKAFCDFPCMRKEKIRIVSGLPDAIERAFSIVTVSDCLGWFRSCNYVQ